MKNGYEIIDDNVAIIRYEDCGKDYIVFPYGSIYKLTDYKNYFSLICDARRCVTLNTSDFKEAIEIALSL